MSNNKNKRLIISISIFLVLAIIVILQVFVFNKRNERNFKDILNPVESYTIDKVEFNMPNLNSPTLLTKENEVWKVSRNDTIYTADNSFVENILNITTNVKPARVVAVSKDKFEENNFKDDFTIPVKYFSKGKVVAEYEIGGFEYKQIPAASPQSRPRDVIYTFIKEPKSEIIYAIEGFLRQFFNNDLSTLRNKTVYSINKDDILEIVGIFNDQSNNFSLTKDNEELWIYNGNNIDEENIKSVQSYLQKASSLTNPNFFDGEYSKVNLESISIKGNNFSPITINFYPVEGTEDYIIKSNTYNESVFLDRNGTIRSRFIFNL
ncbi:DUF4340 domain-containing protein [Bacteroidales bacterium OttesenSCG-928-K03]|nr:DUF4340 domain-containing protein [Bacteroidales bacterium OttesenSCG-928-K22]MDL2242914.1 DUF4340 domain-containing protein [Bacteroidales bacterium OttesenSCG-928-K03]